MGSPQDLTTLGIDPLVAAAATSAPEFIPAGDDRPATLVIATGDRRRTALLEDALVAAARRVGASPLAPRLVEDTRLPLTAFGVASEQFTGRLYRTGFDLALPADTLVADYGSVELRLAAAYAPGLDDASDLGVVVNGQRVATLPFGVDNGQIFKARMIELPLSAFRPGPNRVEIEARTPRAGDADCNPNMQISGAPRFLMMAGSSIAVPALARMARLPDLSGTLASGRTGAGRAGPLRIAPAAFDAATLSAAGTLYLAIALAAPEIPPLEFVATDASDPRGALVVGAAADLPPGLAALVASTAARSPVPTPGVRPCRTGSTTPSRALPPPGRTPACCSPAASTPRTPAAPGPATTPCSTPGAARSSRPRPGWALPAACRIFWAACAIWAARRRRWLSMTAPRW
ncbi:cellulose biosynthesis cyclic di-GMP-binding regulatory protein BcsB [Methylobrevis pamukkalensis]|uniref:Cyclic di-GMP-binding protein n=1 Tax=Methylobrevis pamukkalensis TaxID=1439726 RepID=A0A1E3GY17_9HYPH|nr:cellulose biosynthesis cyclic di-GMP-binding regulatory protein BcsB [Methylobrevis pamukkalensis]ODN68456.1 Bacterial cellulose synthase subunit [Methylobrevis pamukkalensis]